MRKTAARPTAVSHGKIFHAGSVEGDTKNRFLDTGKSWDEAKMFRPAKADVLRCYRTVRLTSAIFRTDNQPRNR